MATSYQSRLGSSPEEGMKAPVAASSVSELTLYGEQTVNSVSVVSGDRVLVKDQDDSAENGIYVVSVGTWKRASDFNAADDVKAGILVPDSAGGVSANSAVWMLELSGEWSPGVTEITFVKAINYSGYGDSDVLALGISPFTTKSSVKSFSGYSVVTRISYDGSWWDYYATSTDSENGGDYAGTIIEPDSGIGRWIRLLVDGTITPEMFGAVGVSSGEDLVDSTNEIHAAMGLFESGEDDNNANMKSQPTLMFSPNKRYLLTATKEFVSLNNIRILAHGAVIKFDIDGPGIYLNQCWYADIRGGSWLIARDTANAEAFKLVRAKASTIANLDISSTNLSGFDSYNRPFSLHAEDDATILDVTAYNTFRNIRCTRLGNSYYIGDAACTSTSRVVLNKIYEIENQCFNGPKYEAAVNNYMEGDMETPSSGGYQLALLDNENGVGSCENGFDVKYIAGSETVVRGDNSVANSFKDYHGANSQNSARTHGNGIFAGMGYVDIIDVSTGGIRRVQPSIDKNYSFGGCGGTNLIPYSNDFSQWTDEDCVVSDNTALTDPDGGFSPNGRGKYLTSEDSSGYVMAETAVVGNSYRYVQHTGRVWLHSDVGGEAKIVLQSHNGSVVRTQWTRSVILTANQWTLAMVGALAETSGGSDTLRLLIYPSTDSSGGVVTAYEAGIYKGYGKAHLKTDGSDDPRQASGVVGENLVSNGGVFLGGVAADNEKMLITSSDSMPTSGDYIDGDIVLKRNSAELGTSTEKYTLLGWRRLTTGSSHVISVDWVEMRVFTGN